MTTFTPLANIPVTSSLSWFSRISEAAGEPYLFLIERDKIKAIIFFILTALLATVAALITHFDALAHAAGLSVTDKGVSGILPLWVMAALRSLAVIGFLLASRLKGVSIRDCNSCFRRGEVLINSTQTQNL